MIARRLSPVIAAVVVTLAVSSCTTPPPETTESDEARAYVQLLRGENDLAHASLEIPATSSLPTVASAIAAIRYAQRTPPAVSRQALARLTQRSGEEPSWAAFYLCQATGGDPAVVSGILGAETVEQLRAPPEAAVESVNDVADRVVLESTRRCLGSTTELDAATRGALERHSAGNPLVAARVAELFALVGAAPAATLGSADVRAVETAIAAEGCTEWTQAASIAVQRLATATPLDACARSTTVEIIEPTSLTYAIAAGMPPAQVAALLDHNAAAVERWLSVEATVAHPDGAPLGLGTLASTRDALALLRLRGDASTPEWMSRGVVAASKAERNDPSELLDLLHLCTVLEAPCDDAALAEANRAMRTALDDLLGGELLGGDLPAPMTDGAEEARLLETAIALGHEPRGHCTGDTPARLLDDAPQLLAMLATVDKACVQSLDLGDEALAREVERAVVELRPEDALALCLLRSLSTASGHDSSTFPQRARAALDGLWLRFGAEHGPDFLSSARPLRVELLTAKADQWLE